jgi:endoglucanase
MTIRPIPLALAVCAALATFTACGGGGGGGTPAPAPVASVPVVTPPVTATPAPVPTTPAPVTPVTAAACAAAYVAPVALPAAGQTFCANLSTAPDANGMGLEAGKACQARKATDIVKEMGQGWNLGNALDASGAADPLTDETAWGNPKITKSLVDAVRKAGFTTLRVPVSWDDHISGSADTIDPAWLARVEEVAHYGLDNGMTVIVNIHHNKGWEAPTYANEAVAKDRLVKLWTQIGTRFKGYDHHLVFEAMNEPRAGEDWEGVAENFDVVNRLNAAALTAIRATGGNNARRLVMLPSYVAAPGDKQLNGYVLPSDPMIAVSSHAYYPYPFALMSKGETTFTNTGDLDALFNRLNTRFVSKGIPVVLGEWGSTDRNNLAERVKHASYYVQGAHKVGIPTVWWDNGTKTPNADGTGEAFAVFDRANASVFQPDIVNAIICAAK